MKKSNPFISNEPLNPRLHGNLIARRELVEEIEQRILAGEFCLVLGPKYSGRTTLLKALEERLRRREQTFPILLRPFDLDMSGENRFFETLGQILHHRLRKEKKLPEGARKGMRLGSPSGPDAFNLWLDELLQHLEIKIVFLFDGIDRIPPHILTRIAHIGAAIFNTRKNGQTKWLEKVSFNFAGSISLRLLTLYENPQLSPFNVCSNIVLRDLKPPAALNYLNSLNEELRLNFRYDAITAIIDYASGDLNLIQSIAGLCIDNTQNEVTRENVNQAVESILNGNQSICEECLLFTSMLVEEDVETLDLVLKLLREGVCRYEASKVQKLLYKAFEITYPEIAGATILERENGQPRRWAFRNRIIREYLQRRFQPKRLVKTYIALGDFEQAMLHCEALLSEVHQSFARDILRFDDNELKDAIIAMTNSIFAENSHEFAYKFFSILLKKAFGCQKATYFDYDPDNKTLRSVKYLSHLFDNDGTEYRVDDRANKAIMEVRVFRSKLYAIESIALDQLKIAIPLENIHGDATGVISIFTSAHTEKWAQLNLRVQLILRALRSINIALNKVELDNKNRILEQADIRDSPFQVFVAHQFSKELLTNLREHLGRASKAFKFIFADDDGVGFLLAEIRRQMTECDLSLFEMSHPNNNVYIEVGMNLFINNPGLIFLRKHRESGMPRLLKGIIFFEYRDYCDLLEDLNKRLEQVLRRFYRLGKDTRYIHFLGQHLPRCEKRDSYVAVIDHNYFGDQRDYRGRVTTNSGGYDVIFPMDKSIALTKYLDVEDGFSRNYPLIRLYLILSYADAIVIRSECVDDVDASSTFIALGMCLASGDRKICLTRLLKDFHGKPLKVPSDIEGWDFSEYESLEQLEKGLRGWFKDNL